MEVSDIINVTDGKLVFGNPSSHVTRISTDTRTLQKGDMFLALDGENYDGHNFVEQAMLNGAAGAIISSIKKSADSSINKFKKSFLIEVTDTLKALGDLAKFHRSGLQTKFIAVTGSNGKTTTKDMIYHVLRNFKTVSKSRKSFNNLVGVPLTIFDVNATMDFCVVEMGTNATGEIRRLSEIILPNFTILTNISPTHLEGLGSIEGVANAKSEFIDNMADGGVLITNADDDWCNRIANRFKGEVISFGFNKNANIKVSNVKRSSTGFVFTVNGSIKVNLPIIGRHNVYNALAVMAMCEAVGISMEDVCNRFVDFKLPSMRMEKHVCGDMVVINDGYNSNPSSMSAALEELSQMDVPGRKVIICGDMLELGNYTEKLHKEIGAKIANDNIDFLWTVGPFSRFVAEEAIANGMSPDKIRSCETSEEVCSFVPSQLRKDDTVLIKGSRKIKLECVLRQIESCFSKSEESSNVLLGLV